MFSRLFKKKQEQKIIWDYIPVRPSNVAFEAKGGKDLADYLVPLSQVMPKWFKSLRQTKDYLKQFPNVRTCPSFVELFKNSYAFVAPCDFQIKISASGMDMIQPEEGWISITSHTALPPELGGNQMGELWDKNLQNIKIMTGIQLGCSTGEFNIMHLPSYYHDPKSKLFSPPGVSTITEDNPLDLNVNVFIDLSTIDLEKGETIAVKHGTPLAYIYMPFGLLPYEKGILDKKMRKSFLGDYDRQLKEFRNKNSASKGKCPFPFLH